MLERKRLKLEKTLGGIRDMPKMPDAVFVVDTRREHIAVREARKLGIPVIGVVDTNCDPDEVDYVIPGNDDAIRAIRLFSSAIADACIEGRAIYEESLVAATDKEQQAAADKPTAKKADEPAPEKAKAPAPKKAEAEAEVKADSAPSAKAPAPKAAEPEPKAADTDMAPGLPISTTHALIGSLVGGGLMAVAWDVNFAVLGGSFFAPLLLSPIVALLGGSTLYLCLNRVRLKLGIKKEWCFCMGTEERITALPGYAHTAAMSRTAVTATVDSVQDCTERYIGAFLGVSLQKLLDSAHYLSAGVVSFARGLNDTPKIVALLLAAEGLGLHSGMLFVATGMAAGGLLGARKVAQTLSKRITPMSHGQGFAANLVTGVLVICASRLGLPVSTTHVSVGSIFGIGLITKRADTRVVGDILLAWVFTLPVAAILGATVYMILRA